MPWILSDPLGSPIPLRNPGGRACWRSPYRLECYLDGQRDPDGHWRGTAAPQPVLACRFTLDTMSESTSPTRHSAWVALACYLTLHTMS